MCHYYFKQYIFYLSLWKNKGHMSGLLHVSAGPWVSLVFPRTDIRFNSLMFLNPLKYLYSFLTSISVPLSLIPHLPAFILSCNL